MGATIRPKIVLQGGIAERLVWDWEMRVLDLFRCMRCRGGRVVGCDPWSQTGVEKEY